jgi:hypothetical protein
MYTLNANIVLVIVDGGPHLFVARVWDSRDLAHLAQGDWLWFSMMMKKRSKLSKDAAAAVRYRPIAARCNP